MYFIIVENAWKWPSPNSAVNRMSVSFGSQLIQGQLFDLKRGNCKFLTWWSFEASCLRYTYLYEVFWSLVTTYIPVIIFCFLFRVSVNLYWEVVEASPHCLYSAACMKSWLTTTTCSHHCKLVWQNSALNLLTSFSLCLPCLMSLLCVMLNIYSWTYMDMGVYMKWYRQSVKPEWDILTRSFSQ